MNKSIIEAIDIITYANGSNRMYLNLTGTRDTESDFIFCLESILYSSFDIIHYLEHTKCKNKVQNDTLIQPFKSYDIYIYISLNGDRINKLIEYQ